MLKTYLTYYDSLLLIGYNYNHILIYYTIINTIVPRVYCIHIKS